MSKLNQFHFYEAFRFLLVKNEWRGGEDSLTKSFTMHNKAEFLSRLSYNAYEFHKWEMRFHLRKSVVTSAKKIIKVNGTFIA